MPWVPHGLRATVITAFALGGLGLSAVLVGMTYLSARHLLIEQRERSAIRQATLDAPLVNGVLSTHGAEVSDALGAVSPGSDTVVFVLRGDTWYSSSLDLPADVVSDQMREAVTSGQASIGWTASTSPHAIIVGIPLPASDAAYFEVTTASELDKTLTTLRTALLVSAAVTTGAGMMFGRTAARRLLTPLDGVTTAATRISTGDLRTRLSQTDDPDLVALVAAFNNMVDALDQRIQHDARFAADVSHELKTPLTTLTTSLAVVQGSAGIPGRAGAAIDLMAVELERFRRCLEDLLALGRLDAGVSDSRRRDVDVRDFVRRCLASSGRSTALLAEPAVDGEPGPGPSLDVLIDPEQVDRALTNLLENAESHGGGVAAVRVEQHERFVDVIVDDHGAGVPPSDRQRIFDRFARGGSRGSRGGTGLGLSIVADTALLHGGSVWCTDNPAGGARFVFRLPLSRPSEARG